MPNRKKHCEAEWDAYVRVSGGAPLYEEFKARGAKIIRGPEVTFYEMREFELMPVLGDALMDAGCDHPLVLAHCRSEKPHARGCWVVDAILGKL